MTDLERMRWKDVRDRGRLRYLIVHGISFGVLIGGPTLLSDYFDPFTRGHWSGWRSELVFLIPYSIIFEIGVAFMNWGGLERRYALEPVPVQELVSALELENTRLRRFVLFCVAGLFILAAVLFHTLGTT